MAAGLRQKTPSPTQIMAANHLSGNVLLRIPACRREIILMFFGKLPIFQARFWTSFSIRGIGDQTMAKKKAGHEEDPVAKTVVVEGTVYHLDARHVPGGWFASWHCDACHAVGAPSGTHRTIRSALAAAKRNLNLHHRDSHPHS